MRLDASGIINSMAAIIGALPKDRQAEVLEVVKWELYNDGPGYYSDNRNSNKLGNMDDWDWKKFLEDIERYTEANNA